MANSPPSLPLHRAFSPGTKALSASCFLVAVCLLCLSPSSLLTPHAVTRRLPHATDVLAFCSQLHQQPGPPFNFHEREQSDRFEKGTRSVLIRNARIWTGSDNGTEVLRGTDILLDGGLIQSIGHLGHILQSNNPASLNLEVVDADGRWITPGLVDVHSHLGVLSSPKLAGALDDNSMNGITQPWLRSLDGLNTHDEAYQLSSSGGVTTSLILPGSANAIGGQAFVIKLRATSERSATSMVLEPPYTINTSFPDPDLPLRWRHMKHACGENPDSSYHSTRMDTAWAFREAFNKAKKVKETQDAYCARVLDNNWDGLSDFPQELQWEALVDVLRGRVKVNTHCYESVDLDAFVRLSNEFQFSIAAFHHASEAYLIPDRIKQAYGKPPAIALFAINGGYKREAYRASQYAPRILAEHNLTVLLKSDHPAVNSRYLLHEAQQAYFYGLPENLALASVSSNAAETLGMGHRIGYIRKGYDADLVIWDSHPLALGATPIQIFIDGLPQLHNPFVLTKSQAFQSTPKVPNFDEEARKVVESDGLPDLTIERPSVGKANTIFTNVKSIYAVQIGNVRSLFWTAEDTWLATVIVRDGSVICYGAADSCTSFIDSVDNARVVDLQGGSISPGFVSYGCALGIEEILLEPSTTDGNLLDPLEKNSPLIIGGSSSIIRAVDGLQFGTRHALQAYRSGVTVGVTPPGTVLYGNKFLRGLSVSFNLGANHKLEEGAVVQEVAAVHISIEHSAYGQPSVSTQIAVLRRLLLKPGDGDLGIWFGKVTMGEIPLVVDTHNADIIATLLSLKKEVEASTQRKLRLTIAGAGEAHLLAKELGEAHVGVILTPARPFPHTWDGHRILPGPPLTNNSAVMELMDNGVIVGLGCEGMWSSTAQNVVFNVGWTAIEAGARLSREQAIALGSTNMMKLLGVDIDDSDIELIASAGGDLLSFNSKVVAVLSPRSKQVYML